MKGQGKGWKGESRRHSMARKGVSTVVDQDRRFDVSNFVARGKYIPSSLSKWERADNYIGENYDDYYVVYSTSRDADLLGQSNWNAMLKELEGMDGVEVIRSSHWAVGWVEFILVHEDFEDALLKADDLAMQLENYPVLDEDDWSQREFDDTIENIKFEGKLDDDEARKVFSYLWDNDQSEVEAVDGFGGYPSEEAINKALVHIKQTELKASGLSSDVNQTKRRLIKQAREKGISENFGQNQVRRLRDKYSNYQYGTEEQRRQWASIEALDQWAMNYDGR